MPSEPITHQPNNHLHVAGLDIGATLIKIAWRESNQQKYTLYSSADYAITTLAKILRQHHVTHANAVGIGQLPTELHFLHVQRPHRNPIQHEINTQVAGLKLLAKTVTKLPRSYVLVSIGTGVSYTVVNGNQIHNLPLGSAIGGGTLLALARPLGFRSFTDLCTQAAQGNHKNVDQYFGDLIVAHLRLLTKQSRRSDIAAGLMNLLAITLWKDIVTNTTYKHVILIGSTLRNNPCLKKLLQHYLRASGRTAHFIPQGEFSSAIGALETGALESARH